MKLQPIGDDLIFWCDSQKVPHEVVRYAKSLPSLAQINGLASLHHALPGLYEDTNGVFVSWSDAGHQEKFSMLQIPDAEECSLFRSLVKFYDEGERRLHGFIAT